MKRLIQLFIAILLFTGFYSRSLAIEIRQADYLERQNFTEAQKQRPLTIKGLFILYFNEIGEGIPESYKFIELKFLNVSKDTPIYDALQKGVYLDLIKNIKADLSLEQTAPESLLAKLVKKNFDEEIKYVSNTPLKLSYLIDVLGELKSISNQEDNANQSVNTYEIENVSNFQILNDVFTKIKNGHYDSEKFNPEELLRGAVKGLAEATHDKYTTYFPPVEAKNFNDELGGSFEGIGSQVDMEKPGVIKIQAVFPDSPAEKSGLKAGDQILKIDSLEVTDKLSLQDAVNKIKGPAGTEVRLTILRDSVTLEVTVKRAKIALKYVEYKKLENGDNYIKITIFGVGTYNAFSGAVKEVMKNPNARTIIDLRNNPGGSLDEVASVLNFFVPKGQSVVNIKYKNYNSDINSLGNLEYTFEGRKLAILISKGSASASEIMAGTIKDYFGDNAKLIGENTFGKGSVQTLDDYADGSSFKYTIAKWFTGKTKIGIDSVGIKPDIEIKLDENALKGGTDNQLEYAKNYKF